MKPLSDQEPGSLLRFVAEQAKMVGVPVEVTGEALGLAVESPWPGQIRQLRAMIENLSASQKPRDRVNQMLGALGIEGDAARRIADAIDGP